MKSQEIEELLELKNYLISIQDYVDILRTSPQIRDLAYDKEEDNFYIETDDRYRLKFKLDCINKKK